MTLAIAVAAGLLIGACLGTLGAGGSILAVPVLVYGLGQGAVEATTGALVVVGASAVAGTISARRAGTVLLARGLTFGGVAVAGAVAGAQASTRVPEPVLLAAFATLLLVVAGVLILRLTRRGAVIEPVGLDSPILTFSPTFACACPRALKVLVTATAVGFLTGFLGVGGGFLVVPALIVALGLGTRQAAGTSLVVIAVTSGTALLSRLAAGVRPDWLPVLVLTGVAMAAAYGGAQLAGRLTVRRLDVAFAALVLAVAGFTASQALPRLI